LNTNTVSQVNLLETRADGLLNPATLKITGELCYENSMDLVGAVKDCLKNGLKSVVLDLEEVEMIDSSGLKMLLGARRECLESGAVLRIAAASEAATRIISMSGLSGAFGMPEPVWRSPQPMPLAGSGTDLSKWRVYEYVATSDPYVISILRDKATAASVEAGASGEVLCDIQIAVGEALTNAYKHGSPKKGVNRITLKCLSCPRALAFEIEDEGEAFDADATPEPDPREMRPNGMGIYLMRQAMDEVEFTHGCPGNRVRMVKWLKGG
jgi:anti-anti-sigma factor